MSTRIHRICTIVAATAACLAAGPAAADAASLTVTRANAEAATAATDTAATWRDAYLSNLAWEAGFSAEETAEEAAEGLDGYDYFIVSYDLDACELVGTRGRRAECEVTYWINDGSGCDDNLVVTRTRRGRVVVRSDELACDNPSVW